MAQFIETGGFQTHIRKMRLLYQKRQNALSSALRQQLAGLLDIDVPNAGLHLIARLPEGVDELAAKAHCAEHALLPRPLCDYTIEARPHPALLLGFADMREREIPACVDALGQAIRAAQGEASAAAMAASA